MLNGNFMGRTKMRVYLFLLAAAIAVPSIAADDWYPSKYGAADTIGAMNNLSAEGTVKAAKLIKTGKIYALGVITDANSPAYPPRKYNVIITQSNDGTGTPFGSNQVTANDDILMTYVGIGTQIDGFGHVGINHRFYNGAHAKDFVRPDGITKYGTENIAPAATRGVLLDMTKHFRQNPVAAGTAFNRAEIDAAAKAAGLKIGKGDVVLFHTGWLSVAATDGAKFIASQPGLGKAGAEYLASLGVVMIGADTAALETIPFENPAEPFVVHQTLLAKHGIHILETINTAALAADNATEFMFVLGTPRFKGTVQMVVNPVAIR
jgi:kynurenine formamidase